MASCHQTDKVTYVCIFLVHGVWHYVTKLNQSSSVRLIVTSPGLLIAPRILHFEVIYSVQAPPQPVSFIQDYLLCGFAHSFIYSVVSFIVLFTLWFRYSFASIAQYHHRVNNTLSTIEQSNFVVRCSHHSGKIFLLLTLYCIYVLKFYFLGSKQNRKCVIQ